MKELNIDTTHIIKFPHGFKEIQYVDRDDVLKTIDDNILDKDVAMELIEQTEHLIAEYASHGVWCSLPYMGALSESVYSNFKKDPENKKAIEEVRSILDTKQFRVFSRRLGQTEIIRFKRKRTFEFYASIEINKDKYNYFKLSRNKGENYAKLVYYFKHFIQEVHASNPLIKYETE